MTATDPMQSSDNPQAAASPTVYVIDDEDKLNFRTVTVVRTETDRVLISEGLEEGERVCVTNLAAAIDKMKVRIKSDEDGGAEESTTGGAGGAPEPEA